MRSGLVIVLASAALALAPAAHAEPILPADDPALEGLRVGYERLEDNFSTREAGLFLDPIAKPEEVAGIEAFFAQDAERDFQTFSGKHPFDVLSEYDEHGDEGNFAGIATVGIAARLIVLREQGAPEEEVDRARDAAVRAAIAWHVYGGIGGNGVIARGVRRVQPQGSDPAFPGPAPEIIPLADGSGNPLPADKVAVWRAPVGPGFDGWVWMDDTSKDQVAGYALAVAWLWDALHDDPLVDPAISIMLQGDLRSFVAALMQIAPEKGIDLCLRDADGRLTKHHDLNPREIQPDADPLPEDSPFRNGFNSLLALGIVRAAYHVTGDSSIGKYYYEELIGRRNMAADLTVTVGLMYLGARTNYSNVNMAAIGLASLGRFETDPHVRDLLEQTLTTQFWDVGADRDAKTVGQAWFDAIYGAYSANAPDTIPGRMAAQLGGFPPAPCFERDRVNCDEAELAALSCVAIDGTTVIEVHEDPGHGGGPVAKDVLPMSIRPDSDFMWRSDPHQINGSASTRMDPRGEWLAAYWLGRSAQLGDPQANLSPYARPPLPYTIGGEGGGGEGGGGGAGGGGGGEPTEDGGCSCSTEGDGSGASSWLAAFLAAVALRSRRRNKRAAM